MGVDQCSTRVARVDGGVGLDEVLKGVDAELVAPQCTDNAAGHRLPHAEGVANGQHLVADLQGVGAAQHDHRKAVQVDLEHGQVGIGVCANDFGPGMTAIVQNDFDFVGTLNHMVVGQDVAAGADDHATAQADLGLVVLFAKEKLEPGVAAVGMLARCLAGIDTDHRGRGFLRGQPEAARWHRSGVAGRRLQHRHPARAPIAQAAPVWLERADHKISRQQNSDSL